MSKESSFRSESNKTNSASNQVKLGQEINYISKSVIVRRLSRRTVLNLSLLIGRDVIEIAMQKHLNEWIF